MPNATNNTERVEIYPTLAEELAHSLSIDRYLSQKDRDAIDEDDFAGPHNSFPIDSQAHLDAAAHLIGHAADPAAVKAKAIRIAKRKGFTLPDSWVEDDKKDDGERLETPLVIRADGTHDPVTTTHSHAHPANGSQGSDATHDHSHSHDNDSSHGHSHSEDRAAMPETALLYAPITRIDKEKREVEGVATSEAIDSFGTIFSYDASKKAFKKWIDRTANVREMHERRSVGKGVGVFFDDDQKQIIVRSFVSRSADGENTWIKINEGLLDGYSVGATNPVWEKVERDGKKYPYLVGYDLAELSLVDNASNPDGQGLTICRADGLTDVVDVSEQEVEIPATQVTIALDGKTIAQAVVERAGARISGATQNGIHQGIAGALKGAMAMMGTCGCESCLSASKAIDPDQDGDVDLGGYDDPDNDAESLYSDDDAADDNEERMTRVMNTIMEPVNTRITGMLSAITQRSNAVLARMAGQPEYPTLTPELIRSAVSAELQTQTTTLQEHLTTVTDALQRLATASSFDEVRSLLSEVKGQVESTASQVERIAAQPAPGGPVLNGGGHPVEKRLANQPAGAGTPDTVHTVLDFLQRRGVLNSPQAQTAVSELLVQAMPAQALPPQVFPRR